MWAILKDFKNCLFSYLRLAALRSSLLCAGFPQAQNAGCS